MKKLIFATICSASALLAVAGVAQSEPASSARQSGGTSGSHSQDDHERSQRQGMGSDTSRGERPSAGTEPNRNPGDSPSNRKRDEQVEGASSGTTATNSGRAPSASNASKSPSGASSGGGVAHPKEP